MFLKIPEDLSVDGDGVPSKHTAGEVGDQIVDEGEAVTDLEVFGERAVVFDDFGDDHLVQMLVRLREREPKRR